MKWYVISQTHKKGPYGPGELREMLRTDQIGPNDLLLAKGSRVARKIYCALDALFPGLAPDLSAMARSERPLSQQGQKDKPNQATVIVRTEDFSANNSAWTEKTQPIGHSPAADQRMLEASRNLERERRKKEEEERKRREEQIAKAAARQAQIAIENEKRKRLEAEKRARIEAERRKNQYLKKQRELQKQKERDQLHKKKLLLKKASLDKRVQREFPVNKQGRNRKRNPVPKKYLQNRAAPAHQLPNARSEAHFKKGEFTWAQNRINPTAPRSAYHRSRRRKRPRNIWVLTWQSLEGKLLLSLLALMITVFSAMVLKEKMNQSDREERRRFQLREAIQRQQIPPQQPVARREETKPAPPRQTARTNTQAQTAPGPARKERATPQKKAARTKSNGQKSPSRKAQTRQLPGGWPKTVVTSRRGMQRSALKVVTIKNLRLLQRPGQCRPCQIPAKLQDGTQVLLSSPTNAPWRKLGKIPASVHAKGLITKSSRNYFTVIVQDLSR